MILFAASLVAAVVQRYLAVLVAIWASGEADGRTVFAEVGVAATDVDPDVLFAEAARAYWWPVSALFRRLARRVREGDFALAGRIAIRALQLQVLAMLFQVIALLVAIVSIAGSLA